MAVDYEFTDYKFAIWGEETAKVGTYDGLNEMGSQKKKLLGNGKLQNKKKGYKKMKKKCGIVLIFLTYNE